MRTKTDSSRFLVILLAAALLPACKKQTEAVAPAAEPPAAAESPPAAPPEPELKLLDACHIKMTAPEAHEWKTFWDPARNSPAGQNPSGVRSFHWANANEQKVATEMHTVIPFELGCSSDQDAKPSIGIVIVTYDSKATDVPMAPGTYPIVPKTGSGKNKPGQFIVGILMFGDKMFTAKSGSLKVERFDGEGAKGSFTIDGNEILTGSRPLHVEGTFDMPCRLGMLQGACKSNKAEQPK